jgi:hypothetical protein
MTDKNVNYTEEMTSAIIARYKLADTDEERAIAVIDCANEYNKTEASIRAKLTAEKVYIKPTRKTKSGKTIVKKAELVSKISKVLDVDSSLMESLEKATKFSLETILNGLSKVEHKEDS